MKTIAANPYPWPFDGTWSAAAREVVRASPEERRSNPRSTPAKLRWARRA